MGAAPPKAERSPEEGGKVNGKRRSRTIPFPLAAGEEEDLVNIEFKRDQDLNPWRYRTIINGSQIRGPLRPDPAAACQDRARMEKEQQELKEEGRQAKTLPTPCATVRKCSRRKSRR